MPDYLNSGPDGILMYEDGLVFLGDEQVPGILVNQSIRGQVKFDEGKPDGLSGKVKTPMGWEDADISLTVELLSDDDSNCYDKLAVLNALFKGTDNGGNPKVFEIVNMHAIARGVDKVVFAGLQSTETDQDDTILCALNFVEHNPPVVKTERRVVAKKKAVSGGGSTSDKAAGKEAPSTKAPDPSPDEKVAVDVSEPPATKRRVVRGFDTSMFE